MNNKVVLIVAGIAVLGLVGWNVLRTVDSVSGGGRLVEFQRWVGCEACGAIYAGVLAETPDVCEKCGAQALWAAAVCREPSCGHKFAVNRDKLRQARSEPSCPKCRSRNVGGIPDPMPES